MAQETARKGRWKLEVWRSSNSLKILKNPNYAYRPPPSMEDSFNVRVGRTFGALSTSSSSNSQDLSSLWCLTDEEIERHEWKRDKESPEVKAAPKPFLSNGFLTEYREKKLLDSREELEKDLEDLDDEDLEEDARGTPGASSRGTEKPEDYNDEDWEIKSNIGKDCSLDYEEEEDHYDKVAVGRDGVGLGDRLYMKEINDYETDADILGELPTSSMDVARDPRANLMAAKIRLKEDEEAMKKLLQEDAEAARKIDSLRVSDDDAPNGLDADIIASDDGNLKSILKRKDAESDTKSHKRVRFDPECRTDDGGGPDRSRDVVIETKEGISTLSQEDIPSGIPDYMRNPSKYTRYTFDTSDVDDASNRQAYLDFLNLIKKSDNVESQQESDLKSITYIPRQKAADTTMVETSTVPAENKEDSCRDSLCRRDLSIGIAAAYNEDGSNAMEEDEPLTADYRNSSHRSDRQYRVKLKASMQFDD